MGKSDVCGRVMGGWEVDEEVRLMKREIVVVYLPIYLSRSARKLTDDLSRIGLGGFADGGWQIEGSQV